AAEDPGDDLSVVDIALLVRDALDRLRRDVAGAGDLALAHEVGSLRDRIKPLDLDITVVDKALELLRGHARGGHDGGSERHE
ncbi:MAG TPA: hypothetical protein VD926_03585, partial [Acidimicrobiales bacterium]|nr:hypothetical protein [Acidimicrobiales bacterium]